MKSEKKNHWALHEPSERQEGVDARLGPPVSAQQDQEEQLGEQSANHGIFSLVLGQPAGVRGTSSHFVPQPDTPSSPTGSMGLTSSNGFPIPVSHSDVRNW